MQEAKQQINKTLILLSVVIIIALSWYYMLFLMSMNMSPVANWNSYDLFMLFIMWAVMMFGMMLPSAIPVILLVNKINQQRLQREVSFVHSAYFVMGYLAAWSLYSLLISLLQYYLQLQAIINPMMVSAELWFSSLLLIVAGIYQWLPIKQRCLNVCRSPLNFVMKEWGEGSYSAIRLGFKHGQYCLGCCWFLMALLFVAGVMDLVWIALLTLVVLSEKLLPKGEVIARILGIILIAFAIVKLTI